jgi:hypothetical protein
MEPQALLRFIQMQELDLINHPRMQELLVNPASTDLHHRNLSKLIYLRPHTTIALHIAKLLHQVIEHHRKFQQMR